MPSPQPSPGQSSLAWGQKRGLNRQVQFNKVTLAGVGLLGGSLGLALRQRGLSREVHGLVRREASIAECERLGVVDRATLDPRLAVEDSDLIVLCTPISTMPQIMRGMLPFLKVGVVVTDVGSVKGSVVAELDPERLAERRRSIWFIPRCLRPEVYVDMRDGDQTGKA